MRFRGALVVTTIPYLAAVLIAMALAFYLIEKRRAKAIKSDKIKHGIPDGKVIYSDLDGSAKPLRSRQFGITGKPDYIIRDKNNALIPVELKSGLTRRPHRGHVLQLAAYCLLIEEIYGRTVPYGIIVYGDGLQHFIEFDSDLKAELLSTVADMRSCWNEGHPRRTHSSWRRCSSCLLREDCSYCLAKIEDSDV